MSSIYYCLHFHSASVRSGPRRSFSRPDHVYSYTRSSPASFSYKDMASDGSQKPGWYGSPFPHLMYSPGFQADRNTSYAQESGKGGYSSGHGKSSGGYGHSAAAPAPTSGSDARLPAGTGTWHGSAPRGYNFQPDDKKKAAAPAAVAPRRIAKDVPIRGGGRMPLLGFGTYKVASPESVKAALAAGYRHFDCASVYDNEAVIGEGLREHIAQHGRASLFITGKVWNDAHRPADVEAACRRTLADLGCTYLDLYLVHWPVAWKKGTTEADPEAPLEATWRAMEALVDQGLVRAIGVSNFNVKEVEDLLQVARVKPAVNQVELHPLLAQRKLVGICTRLGLQVVAYSPLGVGAADLLAHPAVVKVAERTGRTPGQVLLRWNCQRGVAVIPKASSPAHIAENAAGLFEWELDHFEKALLDGLDAEKRFVKPEWHDFGSAELGGPAKPSKGY